MKWIEDRLEHLKAANYSRDVLCEVEIAAQRDGTLLGMQAHVYGDMGAYIRTHGGLVPSSTAALLTGPYHIPAYQVTVSCVMTNKMGLGTYRAPGRYQSCFIRERLLDIMAADLGIDPVALRLKNFIQPSEMPYTVGKTRPDGPPTVFDSGNYPSAFRRALDQIDYNALQPLRGEAAGWEVSRHRHRMFCEETGQGPFEGARVVVSGANQIAVYLGITSLGQGHETTMAQILPTHLECPRKPLRFFMAAPT